MSVLADLWAYLGITPIGALAVALATTVLYLAFIVLTRVLGSRVLASLSSFDLLVVIVLGAILGRATMGDTPTLAGGLIALVTLFTLEGLIGQLRKQPRWERFVANQPAVLMAGSRMLHEELHRQRITEAELRSRLRQAGIRSDAEVAAVVLEPSGTLSVLRRGEPLDPAHARRRARRRAAPAATCSPAGRGPRASRGPSRARRRARRRREASTGCPPGRATASRPGRAPDGGHRGRTLGARQIAGGRPDQAVRRCGVLTALGRLTGPRCGLAADRATVGTGRRPGRRRR